MATIVPSKRRVDDASALGGRRCECDLTAVRKTVQKDGPNQGRAFWACPSSKSAQCGFFEWDDEPVGAWAGDGNGGGAAMGGGGGGGGGGEARTGGCFKVSVRWADRDGFANAYIVWARGSLVERYDSFIISLLSPGSRRIQHVRTRIAARAVPVEGEVKAEAEAGHKLGHALSAARKDTGRMVCTTSD